MKSICVNSSTYPEEYDKVRWERMVRDKAAGKKIITDPRKV